MQLTIPWWGRLLVLLVKVLPLPPQLVWIKAVLPAIIAAIEALPKEERAQARQELTAAATWAKESGNLDQLGRVLKKHCSGVACPSDTVSN